MLAGRELCTQAVFYSPRDLSAILWALNKAWVHSGDRGAARGPPPVDTRGLVHLAAVMKAQAGNVRRVEG